MIPAAIQKEAAKRAGCVGRALDSQGKHIAFWYSPPDAPDWRVYRATTAGMLHVLRNAKKA